MCYISRENCEWICKRCHGSIHRNTIPKLSINIKRGLPKQPAEFQLQPLEEQLILLCIPLIQVSGFPAGGQNQACSNIINVPIHIATTINTLPRKFTHKQ